MEAEITLVKVGGKVLENAADAALFLNDFAALPGKKMLVHGGGVLADAMANRLNVPQTMVEGRRITDAETLEIVTMVYGGLINRRVVAQLQALNVNALGISGADAGVMLAHKRQNLPLDYGFVGDVDEVNAPQLQQWMNTGLVPVLCPLTHDGKGQLLNTNADTMARQAASALAQNSTVKLIFCFDLEGVKDAAGHVIPQMRRNDFEKLKAEGVVQGGMIPKLENGFMAIEAGVQEVYIGSFEALTQLREVGCWTRLEGGAIFKA